MSKYPRLYRIICTLYSPVHWKMCPGIYIISDGGKIYIGDNNIRVPT